MKIIVEDEKKRFVYEFDDLTGGDISLFQGRDLLMWRREGKWYGKTASCNHCGICCIIKDPNWVYGIKMLEIHGTMVPVCTNLCQAEENEYLCALGMNVPMGCVIAYSPRDDGPAYPYCSVRFKTIEGQDVEGG